MCQVCFFYVDFLSRPFTNHRTAGEGGRHFIQPSLLLTPALQALRHQLGDYCRELTFALSQQPDSNQESLVSERTSLTTKLRACQVFQKKRTIFFSYIIQVGLCYPQLTLWQLIQPDLESLLVVRSAVRSWYLDRLLFLCWIVDAKQSTQILKVCYPQLVLNRHHSEFRPLKQLGYRYMPLHPPFNILPLITARNMFPLFITARNRFSPLITVEDAFLLVIMSEQVTAIYNIYFAFIHNKKRFCCKSCLHITT